MSVWATAWAWEQETSKPGSKLVLLALAGFADKQGICYPGQETLASMTRLSSRSIRHHLAVLESYGYIRRTARWREDGTRNSDIYQLQGLPEDFAGKQGANRKNSTRQPEDSRRQQPEDFSGDPVRDPDPSVDPSDPGVSEDGHMTSVDLMESWNEHCVPKGLARVRMTGTRQRKTQLRLKEHPSVEFWSEVLTHILASPFLLGQKNNGDRHWKVDFDFLIANDTNAVKIVEGKYDESPTSPQRYLGR